MSSRLCDGLTDEQWAPTDRLPRLVGARQRRAHDRHRAHAGGRAARARRRRGRGSARSQRHRQGQRAVDRELPRLAGAAVLDEFRVGHRAPARRAARADGRRLGPRGIHAGRARSVPPVHGDPRVRLLVPRPGHPGGARPARLPRGPGCRPLARAHPAQGPAVRRREEGGRAAGQRRSCSTSPASPPIVAAVLVPPEGRAVLLDARAGRPDRHGRDGSPHLRAPRRRPVDRASAPAPTGSCASTATKRSATASSTTWPSRSEAPSEALRACCSETVRRLTHK